MCARPSSVCVFGCVVSEGRRDDRVPAPTIAHSPAQVVAAARLPLADVLQRGRLASKWSLREVAAAGGGAAGGDDPHLLCIGSVRATLAWYPML